MGDEAVNPAGRNRQPTEQPEGLVAQFRDHLVFLAVVLALVAVTLWIVSATNDHRQNERLRLELEDQRERHALFKAQQEEGAIRLTSQILELQNKLRKTEQALQQNQQALRRALGLAEPSADGGPRTNPRVASPELAARLRQAVEGAAAAISRIEAEVAANEEAYLGAARELASDRLALANLRSSIAQLKHLASGEAKSYTVDDFLVPAAVQLAGEHAHHREARESKPPDSWPTDEAELTTLAGRYDQAQVQAGKRLQKMQDLLVATQAAIVAAQGEIGAARAEEAALIKAGSK